MTDLELLGLGPQETLTLFQATESTLHTYEEIYISLYPCLDRFLSLSISFVSVFLHLFLQFLSHPHLSSVQVSVVLLPTHNQFNQLTFEDSGREKSVGGDSFEI